MTASDGPDAGHYFDEAPAAASAPRRIPVHLAGARRTVTTDRATFSPSRLDPGTALLLDAAPPPPADGTFLDLGCGWGPIALDLALRAPAARIVAIDVNARSRALCATNAAELGAHNVEVRAPDEVPADLVFDRIWSNPPIRIGKDALHDLLARWLSRLAPDGRAVLVVGRHLGADSLQRWLHDEGMPTARLASKKGYRLLEVAPTR